MLSNTILIFPCKNLLVITDYVCSKRNWTSSKTNLFVFYLQLRFIPFKIVLSTVLFKKFFIFYFIYDDVILSRDTINNYLSWIIAISVRCLVGCYMTAQETYSQPLFFFFHSLKLRCFWPWQEMVKPYGYITHTCQVSLFPFCSFNILFVYGTIWV